MARRSKSPLIYAGSVITLAFGFLLPILLGFFLGNHLDKRFGSSPWVTLLLLMLGIVVGFGSFYKMSKRSGDDE